MNVGLIATIARLELRRLFASPLAWCVMAVVQLILGLVFTTALLDFAENRAYMDQAVGVSDIVAGSLYGVASIIYLLVLPLLTMRMFSEERRSGSLDLLLSSPARITEIVLGKYLGLLGFIAVMLVLISLMPLSLKIGTPLDLGRIAAAALGLFLLLMAFAAAGMFMSALTSQPTVAAVATFGLLLALWLVNLWGFKDTALSGVLNYLSLISHYDGLIRGVFKLSDVLYYLLFSGLFVGLTIQRLDMERR